MCGGLSEYLGAFVADVIGGFFADRVNTGLRSDVFSVIAYLGLGGGCENRFGLFLALLQAGGQLDSADGACGLVVRPAGACEVAPDNAFDGQYLGFFNEHGAAGQLVGVRA